MYDTARVAIYCRVANADQLALNAQIEYLKEYAVERNMSIIKTYCDMSPADEERGALQRLLRDSESQVFKKVLVLKPSRLARNTDMLLDITNRLQQAGVVVEYTDGSTIPSKTCPIKFDQSGLSPMVKYIHYGQAHFDPAAFHPISNDFPSVKPHGGLWASRTDSSWSWKDWCESNEFHIEALEQSFTFTLSETANVLTLRDEDDLLNLPMASVPLKLPWVVLDFEKLLSMGVDAIEVFMCGDLYYKLYGWDCDSILIMNPGVVNEIAN